MISKIIRYYDNSSSSIVLLFCKISEDLAIFCKKNPANKAMVYLRLPFTLSGVFSFPQTIYQLKAYEIIEMMVKTLFKNFCL